MWDFAGFLITYVFKLKIQLQSNKILFFFFLNFLTFFCRVFDVTLSELTLRSEVEQKEFFDAFFKKR